MYANITHVMNLLLLLVLCFLLLSFPFSLLSFLEVKNKNYIAFFFHKEHEFHYYGDNTLSFKIYIHKQSMGKILFMRNKVYIIKRLMLIGNILL